MIGTIETYSRSDVGRVRARNEDGVLREPLADADGYLLAVADGMGGHRAGDVASRTALAAFGETIASAHADGPAEAAASLRAGFGAADRAVRRRAEGAPEYDGMGTTLVAAVIAGGEAVVASVGDSRAYLVDGDRIERVTRDHTLVAELVESGTLAEEAAATHPQRHVISRALGTGADAGPDVFEVDLDGRVLLLCSDGLTDVVDEAEIRDAITGAASLEAAGTALVDLANGRGGADNVSVVLARY